jgi:hypothetical protein
MNAIVRTAEVIHAGAGMDGVTAILPCSALSPGPAGSLGHRSRESLVRARGRGFLDCAPGRRQQCWAQLISLARRLDRRAVRSEGVARA